MGNWVGGGMVPVERYLVFGKHRSSIAARICSTGISSNRSRGVEHRSTNSTPCKSSTQQLQQ